MVAANPYQVGGPIRDPKDFFGRESQLRAAFDLLRKRGHASIVGERRGGKTSLLFQMLDPEVQRRYHADERENLYVYLDPTLCPANPSEFFRDILTELEGHYPDLPRIRDQGAMDERRFLECLASLMPRRLVLLMDNFEQLIACDEFVPHFYVFLRGIATRFSMSMVVATCRRLADCFHTAKDEISPFYNVFKTIEVSAFTPQETDEFIRTSTAATEVPLAEVQELLVRLAGGFPYLVQMACWHAFEAWLERGNWEPATLQLIQQRFEADAQTHFSSIWNRHLSTEERQTLLLLAQGEQPPMPSVVWRLEARGYVREGQVTPELFGDFVLQQIAQPTPVVTVVPDGVRQRGLWLDEASGHAYVDGQRIDPPLTKDQVRLLQLLCENEGRICTSYMVVKAVYGEAFLDKVDDARIAQLVKRLRRRLEPQGKPWRYILNVHGRGLTLGDGNPDGRAKLVSD